MRMGLGNSVAMTALGYLPHENEMKTNSTEPFSGSAVNTRECRYRGLPSLGNSNILCPEDEHGRIIRFTQYRRNS